MKSVPVLYLDLDDTLLSWSSGKPEAIAGAREFLLWALENFEVRWLTTWCPGGEMDAGLLSDLSRLLDCEIELLGGIRGHAWEAGGSKLNGIVWLEHVVLGRPFLWLEDEKGVGEVERRVLSEGGFITSYLHCNVTRDPGALDRAWRRMREWLEEPRGVAA